MCVLFFAAINILRLVYSLYSIHQRQEKQEQSETAYYTRLAAPVNALLVNKQK